MLESLESLESFLLPFGSFFIYDHENDRVLTNVVLSTPFWEFQKIAEKRGLKLGAFDESFYSLLGVSGSCEVSDGLGQGGA